MLRKVFIVLLSLFACSSLWGQKDTLYVSSLYTSHVIFQSDITYADLSNSQLIAVKIIEQNKNMLAIKARKPFSESCSVSALESSGQMHTFIVVYQESPASLVVDYRPAAKGGSEDDGKTAGKGKDSSVSTWKTGSVPLLSEMYEEPRHLYHIGCKEYDIQVLCEDISSYSDITYFVLSLKNNSGISYDAADATFVIESKGRSKRTVKYDKPQFPRSRFGNLSAGPGEYTRIVYSFDKVTLSKDQVLKIYIYENGGQRNLVMTVDTKDINKARSARK